MITSSLFKSTRRAALCLCLGLSLVTLSLPAMAEDLPKFSAPEVNDYVKKFADLTDAYIKASKAKDEAKLKALDEDGKKLETLDSVVETKLKPEEMEAFVKFMGAQSQKLMDAGVTPK